MTVDGAVNAEGMEVGITVTSPSGKYERAQSVRLSYLLSNNLAKYEVLIIKMQWALDTGVNSLKAFSDS